METLGRTDTSRTDAGTDSLEMLTIEASCYRKASSAKLSDPEDVLFAVLLTRRGCRR